MICSAGVGRTGTLIALDVLLQTIDDNKEIDVFGCVSNLRKQRMKMVQTEVRQTSPIQFETLTKHEFK